MQPPDNLEFKEQRLIEEERANAERRIAYFSMEIGLNARMPTYSGGLGVLAGDTVKSFADLSIPAVAVTLFYREGYFDQELNEQGLQRELPDRWNPADFLTRLGKTVTVEIEGRQVLVQAWRYLLTGISEYDVPVIFLDTGLEANTPYDRGLCDHLYGGDDRYRLCQEAVLGIGGVRMLKALGFVNINKYHMNEGHASLLALELLNERKKREPFEWDLEAVKLQCVFTTHTPVPAGHDQFDYGLVRQVLGDFVPPDVLQRLGGGDRLNMTRLALNLSHYVNGVAREHGRVSREMFPGYDIESITNGVHSYTWVSDSFRRLYTKYIPGWANDPFSLRYALSIPLEEIAAAHREMKERLIAHVNERCGVALDPETLTVGFARRATAYKRAALVFHNIERIIKLSNTVGRLQFIFAGKAHPHDTAGKNVIRRLCSIAQQYGDRIGLVYLEDYNMELAKKLTAGVDLWLNTPSRPQEASGTSGMKAAHNGVPSLSVLDGWWIEGCIEGVTGWAIGSATDKSNDDERDFAALYEKLEREVIPVYYNDPQRWREIMRHAIAINASFFNTHRMVQQYVLNAYLY